MPSAAMHPAPSSPSPCSGRDRLCLSDKPAEVEEMRADSVKRKRKKKMNKHKQRKRRRRDRKLA